MLALRYVRRRQGLSQDELADLVGTRQATISNIEQGHQRPSDDLLGRIGDVLGVSPAFALLCPVEITERVTFTESMERKP